jgi:hypothetical protein
MMGIGGGHDRRVMLRAAVWGGAATLLMLPWVAMRFTAEVDWSGADFMVFGALLAIACTGWELLVRLRGGLAWHAGVALAIGTAFLLVWSTLAVGLVGSEQHPANRLVAGVLLVAVAAAALARCRPAGMARAMLATAAAQVLLAPIAALAGAGHRAWGPCLFFAALWLLAGWLFQRAARADGDAARRRSPLA